MKSKSFALLAALQAKSLNSYRASLRAEVRRYVKGEVGDGDFLLGFFTAIGSGFRNAWKQGAAVCGVRPSEFDINIEDKVQGEINRQITFISSFRDSLVKLTDGGQMNTELAKVEIWVARYGEQVNKARAALCGQQKLKWNLGVAEHCNSCKSLEGIVKTAEFWYTSGILPRVAGATYLICEGYNCKCSLDPTDEPITEGALPPLP